MTVSAAEKRNQSKQAEQEVDHRAGIVSGSAPPDQLLGAGRSSGEGQVSDSRPGPGLWRPVFASGQDLGYPRGGDYATLAVSERLCRARDWLDSTGMP